GQHRVGANAIDRGFKWQLVTVVEGEQREVAFSFVEDPLSRVYAAADPNEALHWIVKGGSVRGEGGYGEAVEYFRKALTMDPDNVSAHRELARTLPGIQDWQGALQHAERYLELDPAAPDADFTREVIAELKRRIAGLPFSWESK
ncbi:MAG: tetratricopeptide repeat protein, partial [Myxococcota bacterium]